MCVSTIDNVCLQIYREVKDIDSIELSPAVRKIASMVTHSFNASSLVHNSFDSHCKLPFGNAGLELDSNRDFPTICYETKDYRHLIVDQALA